jgi:hypothetical protein
MEEGQAAQMVQQQEQQQGQQLVWLQEQQLV